MSFHDNQQLQFTLSLLLLYCNLSEIYRVQTMRCRKSKLVCNIVHPYSGAVKVLLLVTSVYHTYASPIPE